MAFEKYTKPPSQRNTSDTKPVGNFKTGMKRAVLDEPKAKFFQHEAGEVVDVILNSSHPDFMKMSDIGSCKIRLLDSEFALPKAQLNWYRCVETNIKEYPLVGEYVVAVKYMGKFYWTHKINVLGSINNNAMFHFTTGNKLDNGYGVVAKAAGYAASAAAGAIKNTMSPFAMGDLFKGNTQIAPLAAHEGHTMFNGRFGQSIRFGNRARLKTQKGYQSDAGTDPYKSPHIIIRSGPLFDESAMKKATGKFVGLGKPIEEDINKDASSIWITTKEDVPLSIATAKEKMKPYTSVKKPSKYNGQQIVVNSDRIILNTKKKQLLCFSKQDMYLNSGRDWGLDVSKKIKIQNMDTFQIKSDKKFSIFSKDKVNIDAKKNINFGDKKGELIVKGETLHKLLKELIDAVKQSLTPAACVAGPYPVTLTNPAFLEKVKAKLSKMLSDRVTTI